MKITSFATIFLLLLSAFGYSQETAPQKPAPDQPLTGIGLQVKVGGYRNYAAGSSQTFWNISYKGRTLLTHGAQPDPTQIGEDPIKFGDQPLTLKVENGLTQIGGSLLQGLEVSPITLAGIPKNLRLVAGLDAQLEKQQQTNYQLGLEYKLDVKSSIDETFAAIGGSAQRHADSAGNVTNRSTADYRGRLGFGFDFAVPGRRLDELIDYAMRARQLTGEAQRKLIKKVNDEKDRNFGAFVWTAVGDHFGTREITSEDMTSRKERDAIKQIVKDKVAERARTLASHGQPHNGLLKAVQPRLAVFAEFDGSYRMSSDSTDSRYRSMYSGNVKLYFDNTHPDDGYIWLRYENGFSRAEPNARANSLVLTFGKNF